MENFLDSQVLELVKKHAAPIWGANHQLLFVPKKVLFALNSLVINKEYHAPNLLKLFAFAATETNNDEHNLQDYGNTLTEICSIFNEWNYNNEEQNKALDGFLWDIFNIHKPTVATDSNPPTTTNLSSKTFSEMTLTQQVDFLKLQVESLKEQRQKDWETDQKTIQAGHRSFDDLYEINKGLIEALRKKRIKIKQLKKQLKKDKLINQN